MSARETEVWGSAAAADGCGTLGGPFDQALATAPTRFLPLDAITDPLPAPHALERIAAYRDAMRRGERFPPIAVIRILGRYWVADGHKRLAACRALAPRVVVVEEWSIPRWLGDQCEQLLKKSGQQWRVIRRSPFDPVARVQARRLFWDTIGHWRRIGRSISTHLRGLAKRRPDP